jgi:phosphonate metabolism protein PhnM
MYLITNGLIVTEDDILTGYEILLQDKTIFKIRPKGEIDEQAEVIDAAGGYVTPGFIDIHSDYIEHMAAPRPTCLMDFEMSIKETERELISHGITTMFHSLSLFKDQEYKRRPIRDPENVRKFMDIIEQAQTGRHLIRHRFHARFEINNVTQVDQLKSYIAEHKVHLVSFMDHTPGQGQYRDLEVFKRMVRSYSDFQDDEIDQVIDRDQAKEKVTIEAMHEIAELAARMGIAIASHDDDSQEKLELVQSLGTTISEFPITMEIARQAQRRGMLTLAGAPNILLGGSHNGNLSAPEAILANRIDILCSDYYPPAMLHAVFTMHEKFGVDLADMFRLVTINPAIAVRMEKEIGSIREGKKADLLIIEKIEHNYPVITTAFVDGKLALRTNYQVK